MLDNADFTYCTVTVVTDYFDHIVIGGTMAIIGNSFTNNDDEAVHDVVVGDTNSVLGT